MYLYLYIAMSMYIEREIYVYLSLAIHRYRDNTHRVLTPMGNWPDAMSISFPPVVKPFLSQLAGQLISPFHKVVSRAYFTAKLEANHS